MPKREERSHVKSALARVEAAVKADTTKDSLVQFRIEKNDLEKLYELAEKNRKPLGTLAREWILERINQEGQTEHQSETLLIDVLKDLQAKLDELQNNRSAEANIMILNVAFPEGGSQADFLRQMGYQQGVPFVILTGKDSVKNQELTEKIRRALAS